MTEIKLCQALCDFAKRNYPHYGHYVTTLLAYSPGYAHYQVELSVGITKFKWGSMVSRERALAELLAQLTCREKIGDLPYG